MSTHPRASSLFVKPLHGICCHNTLQKGKCKISNEDRKFENTFNSNMQNSLRLSDYEYEFEKLHSQANFYEEISKESSCKPFAPKRYL